MMAALVEATQQRWTHSDEMLATIAELVHSLILVTISAHSKKGARLPPPLKIRRPNDPKPQAIRPRELFSHLAGR